MNTHPSIALFEKLYDGFSSADMERATSVYALDVTYREPALGRDLQGRAEVLDLFSSWLEVSTLRWDMLDAFATGDRVATQWRFSGQVQKPLDGVWGEEAVGKEYAFHGATLARLDRDGLIGEATEYWNYADLLAQLTTQQP